MKPLKFFLLEPNFLLNLSQFRFRIGILIVITFLFFSCANIVSPTGGKKDETPPKVLKAQPENASTKFLATNIEIEFDEFIQLKKQQNISISPLLDEKLNISLKKKTVIIKLESPLKKNTTYTINFANCISDITESNELKNFTYVFSTGDYVDSLQLNGKILDYKSLEPQENFIVGIYEITGDNDSINHQEKKPDYFSKTDKEGNFKIQNLKSSKFELIAFEDKNSNFLYDPMEKIAFSSDLVKPDTLAKKLLLKSFEPINPNKKITEVRSISKGKIRFFCNFEFDTLIFQPLVNQEKLKPFQLSFIRKDSIFVFHNDFESDSLEFVISDGIAFRDTFKILNRFKKKLVQPKLLKNTIEKDLGKPISIQCNHPILKINKDKILVKIDTNILEEKEWKIKKMNNKLIFSLNQKENNGYQIIFQDSSFKDIYDSFNQADTIKFNTKQASDYGTIILSDCDTMNYLNYFIQLLNDKKEVVLQIPKIQEKIYNIAYLNPKTYYLRIIIDENKNNKLDIGNFETKKQAEKVVYYPKEIKLRANWEIELKMSQIGINNE